MKCTACFGRGKSVTGVLCSSCSGRGGFSDPLDVSSKEVDARLLLQRVIGMDHAAFDDNSQVIASAAILIEARLRDLVAAVKERK